MKPVHHDLEMVKRELVAMHEKAIAACRQGAKTPGDHALVDMQELLAQHHIAITLVLVEWRNAGQPASRCAQALGNTIAGLCANVVANADDKARAERVLFETISRGYARAFGAPAGETVVNRTWIPGTAGGHA